ncbi:MULTISPECIES: hypothetical protein [unclassified Microbacterium]|uniref:hypothetical protein n=1 Tax=unclassified Microbacterium TaxID=2609290 RepID=UPI001604CA57|nr:MULTISPECIES: hypothetical protein [unclassified Microbacterium]QNA92190.1 hypothetical protein G4G29_06895 [Microbacterium sp. Se63.02b]QYM65455.1 hypothetical protein K1X59_06955 [Microbacterium sp. Se5.02b]
MLSLTETPMPTPSMTVDPVSVTPGFVGFAAIVLVVIAVILLIWDMNRRIRRVRYRDEVREELDAEEAARAAGESEAGTGATDDPRGATPDDGDEEPPAR